MVVNESSKVLCKGGKKRYKTQRYLNGRFVSVGSLVLRVCSVDLQEYFHEVLNFKRYNRSDGDNYLACAF